MASKHQLLVRIKKYLYNARCLDFEYEQKQHSKRRYLFF